MLSRPEIRAKARAALGGNIFEKKWLMALLASLIVAVVSGTLAAIPGIGAVAMLVVTGPIAIGTAIYYLKLSRGENAELTDLLEGFKKDFVGNFLLGFMQALFIMLWSLLFVIPGIVKSYSYAMSTYIKADHPEYTWNQCITESRNMMRGHKFELFLLQLSFIGWAIVASLCLVGDLWLTPYTATSYAEFYNQRKAEYYSENN